MKAVLLYTTFLLISIGYVSGQGFQIDINNSTNYPEPPEATTLPQEFTTGDNTTEVPTTTPHTKPTTTKSTTAVPPTKPTNPTDKPTTEAPHSTTVEPSKERHFDGASFLGGIILAVGLMAIALVVLKFYKARAERNYHTL